MASIHERLKQAREQAGVTLGQLAERTGYALTTLSGVENHHDRPSKRLLERWIEALQLDQHWVETGQGEAFRKNTPTASRALARSDLAAPLRSRIHKARQHAASLLRELDEMEEELARSDKKNRT